MMPAPVIGKGRQLDRDYAGRSTPTNYRYTGQLSQMESIGLYFYQSRFYDPALSHFVSPDSIVPNLYNPGDWNRYSYVRYNPIRFVDPTGHTSACGFSYSDPECNQTEPEFIGLPEPMVKILTTILAMESSSGNVPLDVTYMKAWALLNLYTFNIRNNNRVGLSHWRGSFSGLFNGQGIIGTIEEQTEVLLQWYSDYKNGAKKLGADLFDLIEAKTRQAVNDWYRNGTNSSADSVQGATGWRDAGGLRYPNGQLSEPTLNSLDNYNELTTDYNELNRLRILYSNTGIVSSLYPYSEWKGRRQWTFTWFTGKR